MDDATRHVRSFMASMEQVRDELGQIVRELYRQPEVQLATQFGPSPYRSCDLGVSAELHGGAVVDFWVDLDATDAGWSVHPTVQRHEPKEDGSHIERDLGARLVCDAAALPGELARALRELRASIGDDALSPPTHRRA
ncbi:MAG: hypothetical protein K8T90_18020 [Planctomycetes bacterium]|nr:hypothetical protein [Planctomycetota bacterium]